ncbi:MAG TPA: 3-phosphoshikimate 1-carboxyvinyltransferase [Thermodesulfobacteriota bacterium]|nr:3-phosphoshikimate 1-carboxyvinyltransferase [Thermodesulfobacteriota bacterium]
MTPASPELSSAPPAGEAAAAPAAAPRVLTVVAGGPLRGELRVPGDKSISHRAVMLGALAEGETRASGFLTGEDNARTVEAFRRMGVAVRVEGTTLVVQGAGGPRRAGERLVEPDDVLDCGNSGTTMRLLAGILAGQPFVSVLTGDASLRSRPMGRVVEPLARMGARIVARQGGTRAPLTIVGGPLSGIRYELPIASAQVKSALLLAGLAATGETVVREPRPSRDHTERLLAFMGAELVRNGEGTVGVRGGSRLAGRTFAIPGDLSSAAFFIVAALVTPGSDLLLRDVGLNPTRTGALRVLTAMGGRIEVVARRESGPEPVGDLRVTASRLRGVEIGGDLIPQAIDELPVLAVAAACAEGTTVIRDAEELRVKETDRIASMVEVLARLGAAVRATPDGMVIEGGRPLRGARVASRGDHRTAMAAAVAGLVAAGETTVEDVACIDTSFPGFATLLESLRRG